jgi:hypothetical protein
VITKAELSLLEDVARLLKRHGSEAFFGLSRLLNDPEFCNDLSRVTRELGNKRSQKRFIKTVPVSEKLSQMRASLAEREQTEPEKAQILTRFLGATLDRSILPTLKDIRFFCVDNGLSPLSVKTHPEGAMHLIRQLEPMSLDEIKGIISRIHSVPSAEGGTLEGWSNIIMRRVEQKKRPA